MMNDATDTKDARLVAVVVLAGLRRLCGFSRLLGARFPDRFRQFICLLG